MSRLSRWSLIVLWAWLVVLLATTTHQLHRPVSVLLAVAFLISHWRDL